MIDTKIYINSGLSNEQEMTIINGYDISLPINQNLRINETLDEGNFEFYSNDSNAIRPFTRFRIEIQGDDDKYYYGYSEVETINFKKGIYKHYVYLIEPTKYLERHVLGARAFSSESSFFTTYEDLVNLILETCYTNNNALENFYFDAQDDERLLQTAREFFFSDTTTLFEALEAIALSINAYPRVVDFDKIIFDFFEDGEQKTISDVNVYDEKKSQDLNRYSTSLYSLVKNAVSKNTLSDVAFPGSRISPSQFPLGVAERTEVVRFNEDNAKIITEYPIFKIKSLKFLRGEGSTTTDGDGFHNNGIFFRGSNGVDYVFGTSGFMDLTDFIFDKREWELFDEDDGVQFPWKTVINPFDGTNFNVLTGNNSKLCSLYYEEGSNVIENAYQFNDTGFWAPNSKPVLFNIATVEFRKRGTDFLAPPIPPIEGAGFDSNWQIDNFADGTTPMFQIVYETIQDYPIKQYRNKWENFGNKENTIIYNQEGNIVDFELFGENIKGKIKRIGNEQFEVALISKDVQNFKLGDKIEDYVITEIRKETYKDFEKLLLILNKNFNRKSNEVSIESQKRLFAIPDDEFTATRHISIQEFIKFSKEPAENTISGTTRLELRLGKMFSDKASFQGVEFNYNEFIFLPGKVEFIRHTGFNQNNNNFEDNYMATPIIMPTDNAFLVHFGFKDIRDLYYSIKLDSSMSSRNTRLNSVRRPNFYCDENGEITDFNVYVYDKVNDFVDNKDFAYSYPRLSNAFINNLDIFDTFFAKTLTIKKDAREILKFNLQFNFISEHKDLTVSKNMGRLNSLIRNQRASFVPIPDEEIYIQPLYEKQDENYLTYDIAKGEKELLQNGLTNSGFQIIYNLDEKRLEIVIPQSWKDTKQGYAFLDINDNVLFIVNDINTEEIYITHSNEY